MTHLNPDHILQAWIDTIKDAPVEERASTQVMCFDGDVLVSTNSHTDLIETMVDNLGSSPEWTAVVGIGVCEITSADADPGALGDLESRYAAGDEAVMSMVMLCAATDDEITVRFYSEPLLEPLHMTNPDEVSGSIPNLTRWVHESVRKTFLEGRA